MRLALQNSRENASCMALKASFLENPTGLPTFCRILDELVCESCPAPLHAIRPELIDLPAQKHPPAKSTLVSGGGRQDVRPWVGSSEPGRPIGRVWRPGRTLRPRWNQ